MVKERRKFKRFDAYMNVQCRLQEAKAEEISGLTKDLSREGIKVNTDRPIEAGTLVDLEISLPDETRPVRSTGKVMWSKSGSGEESGYDSGVCFLLIDPIDKFRILDYAYNYWLETKVNDFSDPEELSELN
ncbi:MAG: PilZ domain-containing protein [Candidatus Omnitrophica bacterium]|nr:PilZ domain-containing protein [Candidatus Omnitrophota bacterium]